jgi:hypothetical protein
MALMHPHLRKILLTNHGVKEKEIQEWERLLNEDANSLPAAELTGEERKAAEVRTRRLLELAEKINPLVEGNAYGISPARFYAKPNGPSC